MQKRQTPKSYKNINYVNLRQEKLENVKSSKSFAYNMPGGELWQRVNMTMYVFVK